MVKDYLDFSKDDSILDNVDLMIQEVVWFEQHRSVKVENGTGFYTMFRYGSNGSGPRPESYKEDIEVCAASGFTSDEECQEFYKHIRAGAESGWDFSSRWIIDQDGGCSGGLENIRAKFIVPVDLNSIMYKNYSTLSSFLARLGRHVESSNYESKATALKRAVMTVLFDSASGTWRDYDLIHGQRREFYFASNLTPLWTDCYPEDRREELGDKAAEYLLQVGAVRPGGLVTSNQVTGLQVSTAQVFIN